MNKEPETIEDILKYFHGISFHGIDLSQTLTNAFSIDHMYGRLHQKRKNDWIYRFFRFRLVNYCLARRWIKTKPIDLKTADYLLLTHGEDRFTTLSFPVLENLQTTSRFVIYVDSYTPKFNPSCPALYIEDIPYDFKEMQKGVNEFWRKMHSGLSELQNEFGFSNYKIYSILNALTHSVATVLRSEYLLSKINPAIVFTDYDHQVYSSIILQVAKKMGIPTATLVHGLQGKDKFDRSTWTPILADKVIVWGNLMKEDFQKMGVPLKKIDIGGYPRIKPVTENDRQDVRNKLTLQGIPVDKKIILLVSSSHTEEKPFVKLFFSAREDLPDRVFMVRPHPRESLSWYSKYLLGRMNLLQDPREWSLLESITSADVIVGTMSGTLIDAILLGKKVIVLPDTKLNYWDRPIIMEGVNRGDVLVANNRQELVTLIESSSDVIEIESQYAVECAKMIGNDAAKLTASILRNMALHR